MNHTAITNILVTEGEHLFRAPRTFVEFTADPQADGLLNDLEHYPHAYILACVMDRQMKAERAWLIPHKFSEKLGNFHFPTLAALTQDQIKTYMTTPEPLHRFPDEMSHNFYEAIHLIAQKYAGNAAAIWSGTPPSAGVIYRFLDFQGVGPKIATMAANILARSFKIPFSDYYSIDISVDVHVRRVFTRLGLTQVTDTEEAIIYRARALHPEFPGLLDALTWEIGRNWCKPENPQCNACLMGAVCPTANRQV